MLYDFGAAVIRYLDSIGQNYTHKDDSDEPHSWDFYEHWGMDRNTFAQHVHNGADAGYIFTGPTRPGAVEAVQAVADMGHDIIVITDRQFGSTPEVSWTNTKTWWKENGFPAYEEIHFSADKTIVPTDIFVEDKLENCDALMAAGTTCWLINRPWNQVPEDDYLLRFRIDDVSQYPELVELEHFILSNFDLPTFM